jgi:hypothetical protein
MAITLSGTRITITYESGDPKGDSFDNPYTMQDIYDANIAGGWGVVQKIGNVYIFEASLYIEGSDTYFKDGGFGLYFNANSINDRVVFNLYMCYSYIERCSVQIQNLTNEYFDFQTDKAEFYRINFPYNTTVVFYGPVAKGCFFRDCFITKNLTIDSCIFINEERDALNVRGTPDSTKNCIVRDSKYALHLRRGPAILKNIILINNTFDFWFISTNDTYDIIDSKVNIDKHAIRPDFDGYTILNLKSIFRIYINQAANATAKLYDQHGTLIEEGTLDGDGKWNLADPVTYASRYVETDGSQVVENTKTVYEPFKLVVEKTGYKTLEIPNIYATVEENGSRKGTLSPTVVEGKMEKKNYIHKKLKGQVTTKSISGRVKTKKVKGVVLT